MNTVVKPTLVRDAFAIGTLGKHSLVRAGVAMDKLVFIILLTMNTLVKHSLLFVLLQKSSVSQCTHNLLLAYVCTILHRQTAHSVSELLVREYVRLVRE